MSDDEYRLVEHRGKWAVRVDGRRLSTGFDDTEENREAAERKADEIIVSLSVAPADDLASVMAAYAKEQERKGKDGTRVRNHWSALAPTFKGLTANEVTRELCRRHTNRRSAAGISTSTCQRDLKILKAACTWSNKRHTGEFEYPPAGEPRDRVLTKDEVRHLIDCAHAYHIKLFIHLAYGTAARAGALYELTWMQVNWSKDADKNKHGSIWLGRKANGKKRATVPMTKTLRAVLEEAYKIRETDHVLEYGGKPVASVKKAFKNACRKAGIEDFRIHDMRHTAAVHMAGDGISMSKISQYLGHSNSEITERVYARYQPEHLRDAADALEL